MRKRPVLLGTLLIVAALAIQINYDNQFKNFLSGATSTQGGFQVPANAANNVAVAQRIAAFGGSSFTTDSYIRFSSYLIGTAAVMSILVGAWLPEKKAEET